MECKMKDCIIPFIHLIVPYRFLFRYAYAILTDKILHYNWGSLYHLSRVCNWCPSTTQFLFNHWCRIQKSVSSPSCTKWPHCEYAVLHYVSCYNPTFLGTRFTVPTFISLAFSQGSMFGFVLLLNFGSKRIERVFIMEVWDNTKVHVAL